MTFMFNEGTCFYKISVRNLNLRYCRNIVQHCTAICISSIYTYFIVYKYTMRLVHCVKCNTAEQEQVVLEREYSSDGIDRYNIMLQTWKLMIVFLFNVRSV